MKKITLFFFLVTFVVLSANAQERGPIVISPASDAGIARVEVSCPTFSWTSVEGALGYKVVVFETNGPNVLAYYEMEAIASPILAKEIQGQALSWTPSSEERLISGSIYVWYVQAVDGYGQAMWSEGRMFKVELERQLVGIEETVRESLREKGMSEEVIEDVLEDMRLGTKEVVAYAVNTEGSEGGEPDKIGIQGYEGTYNTFYGLSAGASTTADYNSFFGRSAGYTNTTGNANTFMGYRAGYLNDIGGSNIFIGHRAGYANTSGAYNIIIGTNAGFSTSTGNNNTIIGYQAGTSNYAGQGNIFLGYRAGSNVTVDNRLFIDNSNTFYPLIYGEFDNNVVAINGKFGVGTQSPGYPMQLATNGTNAALVIDRQDGATTYFNATVSFGNLGTISNHPLRLAVNSAWRMLLNSDNSLTMASGATCTAGGTWENSSSRVYKENIQSLSTSEAMDTLKELMPVKYNYKVDKEEKHVGFIAEDVPDLVASKNRKGLSSMDVVAVLTKVVQEQQRQAEEQKDIIDELRERIAYLERMSQTEK